MSIDLRPNAPESKSKRRWFRFYVRDLLLVMVIAALATGCWLDHKRSMETISTLVASISTTELDLLIELNLSRDDKISTLVKMRESLELMHDRAISLNDVKSADAAKKQLDQVRTQLENRRTEFRPLIIKHLRYAFDQANPVVSPIAN